MAKLLQLLFFVTVLGIITPQIYAQHLVCYFGSWADWRTGDGRFVVEDIDPSLCTHVIYAFVALNYNADIIIREPQDYDRFTRFVNLKKKNPNLKTMIAIGGWNEDSSKYSQVFSSANNRQLFVQNSVNLLKKYGFDGLDIDWEYPARRGGVATDKQVFTELLKALRTEFQKYGYLLTIAVSATEESMAISYEPAKIAQYVDFINVMAYDFHSGWEPVLGHNAPLFVRPSEVGSYLEGYNVDASMKAWIKNGVPANKLVMGIGTYGQSFRAVQSSCVTPGCANYGPGYPGPYTKQDGMLGYNEICLMERDFTFKLTFDDQSKVPYMSRGVEWVSYDNEASVKLKVDYVKKNLGGAMVWSIETDDFRGTCGKGKYPIVNAIKKELFGSDVSTTTAAPTTPTTTKTSTTSVTTTTKTSTSSVSTTSKTPITTVSTTTKTPSTTTAAPSSNPCIREGYVRDKNDCRVFYNCILTNGVYIPYKFTCPQGLYFDDKRFICDYQSAVQC